MNGLRINKRIDELPLFITMKKPTAHCEFDESRMEQNKYQLLEQVESFQLNFSAAAAVHLYMIWSIDDGYLC